jgi:hypothetical protein
LFDADHADVGPADAAATAQQREHAARIRAVLFAP